MRTLSTIPTEARFSIGWKTTLTVVLPVIFGMLAATWLVTFILIKENHQSIRQLMTLELLGLDREFSFMEKEVERLAVNPVLINALADPKLRQAALPELIQRFATRLSANSFVLTDPEGTLIFAHLNPLSQYKELPNLKAALATGRTTSHLDFTKKMFLVASPVRYFKTIQGVIILGFDVETVIDRWNTAGGHRRLVAKNLKLGESQENLGGWTSIASTAHTPILYRFGVTLEAEMDGSRMEKVVLQAAGFVLILGFGLTLAMWLLLSRAVSLSVEAALDTFERTIRPGRVRALAIGPVPPRKAMAEPKKNEIPIDDQPDEHLETDDNIQSETQTPETGDDPRSETVVAATPSESQTEKLLEQRLKTSEAQLQSMLQVMGEGFWEWDLTTDTMIFSPRWWDMFGLESDAGERTRETWRERVHQDDWNVVEGLIQVHLSGARDVYISQHRMRHEDGDDLWVLERGRISLWDDQGTPLRMVCSVLDVTQKKNLESIIAQTTSAEPRDEPPAIPENPKPAVVEIASKQTVVKGSSEQDVAVFKWPEGIGLDIASGLEHVGGNAPLYRHLLMGFYEKNQDLTRRLQEMLIKSRYDRINKEIQGIREVLFELGALNLHDQVVALEGILTCIPRRKEAIVRYFEPFCQSLDEWMVVLKGWKESESKDGDAETP
ncbi:MAG: PAS domain-containing protein [Magnetococcus sp. THC-1_WYH]